jgi:hypothetical protein
LGRENSGAMSCPGRGGTKARETRAKAIHRLLHDAVMLLSWLDFDPSPEARRLNIQQGGRDRTRDGNFPRELIEKKLRTNGEKVDSATLKRIAEASAIR